MDESTKIIITLIISIIGIPTAIFGLIKAYIESKRVIEEKKKKRTEGNMNNSSHNKNVIKSSKNKGNVNNTINNTTNHTTINVSDKSLVPETSSSSNNDNIVLGQNYTSLFAEDNKLKTEQIVITKQKNGQIEGTVTLREIGSDGNEFLIHTYTLKGKYTNKVLTAEYYSQNESVDERGAINLKLIDRDILSGFCSFSKLSAFVDDEIRVSPYIWVAGEDKNLLNGTFDFCTKCSTERKVCCCANPNVDMPVFLNSELDLIRKQLPPNKTEKNSFSKTLSAPYDNSAVRQMKRDEKKGENNTLEYTKCHFFDLDEQRCKIYEGRPIDCRLFPYDIKLSEDKKEYVIGYYTTICDRYLPELSVMKKKAHILRPYFFLLYPYLHMITSSEVCQRLKSAEFREIASFKDFVF